MVKSAKVVKNIIVFSLVTGLLVGCAKEVPKEVAKEVKDEISFSDVETEWKSKYDEYRKLCEQAAKMDGLSIGITNDTVKELADEKILRAYAENTALTAEIKQFMINSFSEKDAVHMETDTDKAREEVDAFLDDVVVKLAFSNFEGGIVADVLSEGVKSYISTARSGSSEEEALEAAKESVKEGVICKVKSAVIGNIGDVLDETYNGLGDLVKSFDGVSSVGDYLENLADAKSDGAFGKAKGLIKSTKDVANTLNDSGYEGEPGALINNYYKTAKKASEEVNEILVDEKTTGSDLARLLYKYYQFGSVLDGLEDMGVESEFEWKENYETANELYKRYLYNEKMISLLEGNGNYTTNGNVRTISVDNKYLESGRLVPPEQKNSGEKEEYKKELESDIDWMNEAIGALSPVVDEVNRELAPMQEYRNQVAEIKEKSQGILDYEAKEFVATLNEDGIEGQKEIYSFNSTAASVIGIIPGIGAMSIFNEIAAGASDRYYEHVVKTAELMSKSFEPISVNVKEKVKDYHNEIRVYEELTEEKDNLQEEINNLYLIRDILKTKNIDVSESKEEAYKSLLILIYAYDVTENFYDSINPDSCDQMEMLGDEIDEILDKDDMLQMDGQVKTEEAAEYLIPIYDAGIAGMRYMDDISVDSQDIRLPFMMASIGSGLFDNTRVHYTLYCGKPIHLHDDKRIIDIFISGGKVLSVNGNYLYRNAILNNSGNGTELAEFGQWTRRMCLEEEDSRDFAFKLDVLRELEDIQAQNQGKLTEEYIERATSEDDDDYEDEDEDEYDDEYEYDEDEDDE